MSEYETSLVAVDPVIFTLTQNCIKVLLFKREKPPYQSAMELPGGLMKKEESAQETLERKLKEVLGLRDIFFLHFSTFTQPKRDPRARTISIGYIALVPEDKITHSHSWFEVKRLPPLAFDHKEIIRQAHTYLRKNINSELVRQFLPEKFPLNKLQKVYEIISENTYDNRNFRKQMLAAGIVKETSEMEKNVSHRPAKLYTFV